MNKLILKKIVFCVFIFTHICTIHSSTDTKTSGEANKQKSSLKTATTMQPSSERTMTENVPMQHPIDQVLQIAHMSLDVKKLIMDYLPLHAVAPRLWAQTLTQKFKADLRNQPSQIFPFPLRAQFVNKDKKVLVHDYTSISLLDADTGKECVSAGLMPLPNISSAQMSLDGKNIVVVCDGGKMSFFDSITGKKSSENRSLPSDFLRDNLLWYWLSPTSERVVRNVISGRPPDLFNVASGHFIGPLNHSSTEEGCAATFNSNGSQVITQNQATVCCWDSQTGAMKPNGGSAFRVCTDGEILLKNGNEISHIDRNGKKLSTISSTAKGKWANLGVSCNGNTILARTKKKLVISDISGRTLHQLDVVCVFGDRFRHNPQFSSDGEKIVSIEQDTYNVIVHASDYSHKFTAAQKAALILLEHQKNKQQSDNENKKEKEKKGKTTVSPVWTAHIAAAARRPTNPMLEVFSPEDQQLITKIYGNQNAWI